jgi:mono/diheme cytochrome c family protein
LQLLRLCLAIPALLTAPMAIAADADNGRRLAQMRCVPCHAVVPDQRRDVADAPPFDVIARKFTVGPDILAFLLLDPHPRMNVTFTQREAQDIAAYISTLAR